jgi:hypothetical protein
VVLFVGHQHHSCLWTASLQSGFAAYVLISVMHVLKNVKRIILTIAKDARRHATTALKNVEGWLAEFS